MHSDEVSAKPQPPTQLPDPDNLRDVLAYWVRLKRVEKGWSQERLALESGLARSYLGGVERGQRNIALLNIYKLAEALAVTPGSLMDSAAAK